MSEPDQPPPDLHGLDPGELLARAMNTVQPTGGIQNWTPPTPEELAKLLPQYRIESMIGHGGMGAVYKGFQERLGRTVAIKLLPAELTADEQFVSRFEREARTLAKLQHPGIVSVYDFGQTSEGHLFFVMEFVEGTDLRRILQTSGLNPHQALEVTVQICEALQAAHRQGVIHRDIKPANILVGLDGRVKLADFGLARPDGEETEALTHTNAVMGTPDYMAPEQYGGATDHRADIFALGLTLYEMLTGQLPRGAFVPPSRKVQVDVRIDEVVLKALQEEPDLRYQQASEMKTAVDQIRSGVISAPAKAPTPAPRVPSMPPAADGGKTVVIALCVLSAVIVIAGFFLLRSQEKPASLEVAKSTPVPTATPTPTLPTPTPTPLPIAEASPAATASPMASASPDAPEPSATPSTEIADENPAPATLEEALLDYRWDYKTTKPAYYFVHSLFFEDNGLCYSIGRKTQWPLPWEKTGPLTLHIKYNHTQGDWVFDQTFSSFKGRCLDGTFMEGRRTRLRSDEDRKMLAGVIDKPQEGNPKNAQDQAASEDKPTAGDQPPAIASKETAQEKPLQPAPPKPYFDMLSESGPVITDQVLSALDNPSVPEATVSLWMEDVLDEAAKRPETFQPAYKQASALLAAWKAALRERNQLLSTAKYSGMVMDTTDMDSSRKTTLHMWDWLQYARERDDAEAHENKLQRKADFFASGPPRRWADRAAVLRVNIEKIYADFRKARREAKAASKP